LGLAQLGLVQLGLVQLGLAQAKTSQVGFQSDSTGEDIHHKIKKKLIFLNNKKKNHPLPPKLFLFTCSLISRPDQDMPNLEHLNLEL